MATRTEAARALAIARRRKDAGEDMTLYASMAKLFASKPRCR
jgi:alkylation response protein AidB-like acyl-CoA dehydrogenase